jgi:hypothetical protein
MSNRREFRCRLTPRVLEGTPANINNSRGQTRGAMRPVRRVSLSPARSTNISGRCGVPCERKPIAHRAVDSGARRQTHEGAVAVFRPIGRCSEDPPRQQHTAGSRSRSWHVRPGPRLETFDIRPPKTTVRPRREPARASKAPNAAEAPAAVAGAPSISAGQQFRLSTPTSTAVRKYTPQLRRRLEPSS